MLLNNNLNRILVYNDENDLLLLFSEVKENYDKYGNLIICWNFILLSYSVVAFIVLARVFEPMQEFCKEHIPTIFLNMLSLIIYIVASVLIGIAVKKKSKKYFRKYMVLIAGCIIVKIVQFVIYLTRVKKTLIDVNEECKEVALLEEKESSFFMDILCYCIVFGITFRLKGFLLQLIEINKKLEEMGLERNMYESWEEQPIG